MECTKVCHKYYSGRSLVRNSDGEALSYTSDYGGDEPRRVTAENIESEVMIDFDRAFQRNPEWLPKLKDLPSAGPLRDTERPRNY